MPFEPLPPYNKDESESDYRVRVAAERVRESVTTQWHTETREDITALTAEVKKLLDGKAPVIKRQRRALWLLGVLLAVSVLFNLMLLGAQ